METSKQNTILIALLIVAFTAMNIFGQPAVKISGCPIDAQEANQ